MTSHTFNTVAGTTATGGTGGGAAGVTSNVVTDLVADQSEGSGFVHNQVCNGGSSANADTIMGLQYTASSSTLRLIATDDSLATGTGSGATRFDYAYARGPNSTSNAQTTYNDQTGGSNGPQGTSGSYEWLETQYTDGEGFTETRIDVRWNSVFVFQAMIYVGQGSVTGSDGLTYTKGSQFNTSGSETRYQLTQSDPGKSMYVNQTTSGTITGIRMKVTVNNVNNASGNIAPLRSLTNTAGGNHSLTATGTFDSGWLTSNMSTGLNIVVRHLPNIAGSSSGNCTYLFQASVELWARASGVSDTKVKDFLMSASTIIAL
jgi:hypothetical protein